MWKAKYSRVYCAGILKTKVILRPSSSLEPETDQILADHASTFSPPNARYFSPQIQNELIHSCGQQLQKGIVSECNSANCFSIIAVRKEMIRWRCKWQKVDDKPSIMIDSLIHAKLELYPNIHVALKVLLTMPITSATAERSFSTLKPTFDQQKLKTDSMLCQ